MATAKPLPALRTPGREGAGRGSGPPIRRSGRAEEAPGRAASLQPSPSPGALPREALSARGAVARAGRGGLADSGLRGAAQDAAQTAGSRAAPGCRGGRSEGAGRDKGPGRRDQWARGGGRCAPSGAA